MNFIGADRPDDFLNDTSSDNSIGILTDRSSLPWVQAYINSSDRSGQIFTDTIGQSDSFSTVSASLLPTIQAAVAVQERVSGDLARIANPTVIPPQFGFGIWSMSVQKPNFVSDFAKSDGMSVSRDQVKKLFDTMSVGPCGIAPPEPYEILVECSYFSQDAGIGENFWFRTAMHFTLYGGVNSEDPISIILVFPNTLKADGDRDLYDKLMGDINNWSSKYEFEVKLTAENYLKSKLKTAMSQIYNGVQ